jgi:hypothetical protein
MQELLADNIQFMTGAAIILVNKYNAKSEVNALSIVQTQGSICAL